MRRACTRRPYVRRPGTESCESGDSRANSSPDVSRGRGASPLRINTRNENQMSEPRTKAVLVGAGLGGLTAGLALRRAGVETALFERAASMPSIQKGIGMVIWPNGI